MIVHHCAAKKRKMSTKNKKTREDSLSNWTNHNLPFYTVGDCENVSSILSGSVLLPCSCPERELNDPFYWQKERPKMLVFKYRNGNSTFNDTYKGRGKIFLPEDGKNCSVLLTNVTADDQGQYRCSFNHQGVHRKIFVNLNVYGESLIHNVCTIVSICIHELTMELVKSF